MLFATLKEIGFLILPYDGNPYRIVSMIGHQKKIASIAISNCENYLFTHGQNDYGVLIWKINYSSVDIMNTFGGEGLYPFYCLIEDKKNGWLHHEMLDLFYYAQILQQGENTSTTITASDKISIIQIPNLMRAVGFYPSNLEVCFIISLDLYTLLEKIDRKRLKTIDLDSQSFPIVFLKAM